MTAAQILMKALFAQIIPADRKAKLYRVPTWFSGEAQQCKYKNWYCIE